MSAATEIADGMARAADSDAYARIASAIDFLRANRSERPELQALARHIGLSETYTQRLFSRWAGISPKRFVQYLSVEYAKQRMTDTSSLLDLSLETGLSGAGRLHDLFVGMEAMTPGEFRRAAAGVTIRYGVGPTPFGNALIAFTQRGVCRLSFVGSGPDQSAAQLRRQWPQACLEHDIAGSRALLERVFSAEPGGASKGLSLWVGGTNFQIQVWRALLQVPLGGVLSYRQLADQLGMPRAARAVGSAVARNPVGFLIPCHRVLRGSGDWGVYRWGTTRKMAMCGWEAARTRSVE